MPTGQKRARLTPGALGGLGNERQRVLVQDQHAQGGEQDTKHRSHQPLVAFLLQKVGWAASQGRDEPDTRPRAPWPHHPLPQSWFIPCCTSASLHQLGCRVTGTLGTTRARVPEQSWDAIPAALVETPAFHQQGQAHEHSQLPESQSREQ